MSQYIIESTGKVYLLKTNEFGDLEVDGGELVSAPRFEGATIKYTEEIADVDDEGNEHIRLRIFVDWDEDLITPLQRIEQFCRQVSSDGLDAYAQVQAIDEADMDRLEKDDTEEQIEIGLRERLATLQDIKSQLVQLSLWPEGVA